MNGYVFIERADDGFGTPPRPSFGTNQSATARLNSSIASSIMSSSIELINPKAESVRRAAALQVMYLFLAFRYWNASFS